jgi:regulator of sigma E protease
MGLITALLVLSLLIFLHELGHFSAARFFGVKVEVFSIGFGKKLLTKKIGDTQWSISAIPLGGYVQMKGQDDSDPTKLSYDSDSYTMKKPWQRIVILFAGPFANFLTAFLLYIGVAQLGTPLSPLFNFGAYMTPTVGGFSDDSPAKTAGVEINDTIIAINNHRVNTWGEIGETIQTIRGDITLTIQRETKQHTITFTPIVKPQTNKFGEEVERKLIGIAPHITQERLHFTPQESIAFAYHETLYAMGLIYKSVEKFITGAVGVDKLGGVVSIVDITAKASNAGIVMLFLFTALISVNLGVLNLLPIPALDGGHIIFNLYEWLRGKAPNENVMYQLTLMGWGLLITMMFIGLYNDIHRLLN